MLSGFFNLRLILCLIAGIIFISALKKLSTSNPISGATKGHKYKWAANIFITLAILQAIAFIVFLFQVDSPTKQIEPLIPLDGIVRHPGVHIIWGYATQIQASCISYFIGTLACYGWYIYFKNFISSPSKWWSKILKAIWYIIIWALYINCTDFHYFDTPEYVKTILFIIAIIICFLRRQTPKCESTKTHKSRSEVEISETKEEHIIPIIATADTDAISAETTALETEKPSDSNNLDVDIVQHHTEHNVAFTEKQINPESSNEVYPQIPSYCRFCGSKIDPDSKFCKFCGNATSDKIISKSQIKASTKNIFNKIKNIASSLFVFNLKRSNKSILKVNKLLLVMAFLSLFLGIIGIICYFMYVFRDWSTYRFRISSIDNYGCSFLVFSISSVVFGLIYWLLNNLYMRNQYKILRFPIYFSLFVASIGVLGNFVTTVVSAFKFDDFLNSIHLDQGLLNSSSPYHKESVGLFVEYISRCGAYDYFHHLPSDDMEIVRNAAEENNPLAQYILGKYYSEYENKLQFYGSDEEIPESITSEIDYKRAYTWFKRAADNGNAEAQLKVGLSFLNDGVYDMAENYLRKAVNNNNSEAMYYLGLLYFPYNSEKAMELWQKGAKLKNNKCRRCVDTGSYSDEDAKYVPAIAEESTDTIM